MSNKTAIIQGIIQASETPTPSHIDLQKKKKDKCYF